MTTLEKLEVIKKRTFKAKSSVDASVDVLALVSALECAIEALNEVHLKLTPKIPRMDGKDSWTIQQKFIDRVVIETNIKINHIMCGDK